MYCILLFEEQEGVNEECLHLAETKQGVPLINEEKACDELRIVHGQEKRFSQGASQVRNKNSEELN